MGVAVASTLLLSACVRLGSGCDFDPCPPGKGWVSAVDATGAERWRTEVDDRSETPPLVSGDHVVVTGCKAVHVLDAATGRQVLTTADLKDAVGIAGGLVWGRDAADKDDPGRDVRGVPLTGGPGGQGIAFAGGTSGESSDFGSTFAVSGDRLVGSHGDVVSVFPAAGGPERSVQLPVRPKTRFVPVDHDLAVTASRDGSVLGVEVAGPRLVWRAVPQQVASFFDVRLEVAGATVVASASGPTQLGQVEEVFAMRVTDGRVLWRRPGAALTSLGDGVAVLTADRGTVVVVDLTTGRQLWSLASGSTSGARLGLSMVQRAGSGRLVADGTLTLGGTDPQGQQVTVGVDARTGRGRWRVEGLRQPVALDGSFGVNAWEGRRPSDARRFLGALDARTGRQLWQHQMEAQHFGDEGPETQLAADPARAQTVVADLPSVPHGGCY